MTDFLFMPERKIAYSQTETHLRIDAPSWERLYIDASLALTDHHTALDRIDTIDKKKISITAKNKEQLMLLWLNEILTLIETEQFLPKRIVFEKFDGKSIQAVLIGQKRDRLKHGMPEKMDLFQASQIRFSESSSSEPHFSVTIDFYQRTQSPVT
jgi:SHS2 domain-containing protein